MPIAQKTWNYTSVKSLVLDNVEFENPEDTSDLFSALVSLQNLTLCLHTYLVQDYSLHCPHVVNLQIKVRYYLYYGIHNHKIVGLAPKLSTFTSVGIFTITLEDSKLDNVYIKLRGWINEDNFLHVKLK